MNAPMRSGARGDLAHIGGKPVKRSLAFFPDSGTGTHPHLFRRLHLLELTDLRCDLRLVDSVYLVEIEQPERADDAYGFRWHHPRLVADCNEGHPQLSTTCRQLNLYTKVLPGPVRV